MMSIMSIHINETLENRDIRELKNKLMLMPHVLNIELNVSVPHNLTVEYESHYNIPVTMLNKLSKQGLHTYIQLC